mmetsp:Transcript_15256/g.43411  ORF Transcript_15256/g.43411 Transcript_15256/m.43411 type:complete len:255 (-) Transcript_15256:241-1005(-)
MRPLVPDERTSAGRHRPGSGRHDCFQRRPCLCIHQVGIANGRSSAGRIPGGRGGARQPTVRVRRGAYPGPCRRLFHWGSSDEGGTRTERARQHRRETQQRGVYEQDADRRGVCRRRRRHGGRLREDPLRATHRLLHLGEIFGGDSIDHLHGRCHHRRRMGLSRRNDGAGHGALRAVDRDWFQRSSQFDGRVRHPHNHERFADHLSVAHVAPQKASKGRLQEDEHVVEQDVQETSDVQDAAKARHYAVIRDGHVQ